MFKAITGNLLNLDYFTMQSEKIKKMKWILGISKSNKDYSLVQLKHMIDDMCDDSFPFLAVIHNYLTEMPQQIKNVIDDIILSNNDKDLCLNKYFNYLKKYKNNSIFIEYENYILIQRGRDAMNDASVYPVEILDRIDEVQNFMIRNKKIQLSLVFRILSDTPQLFRCKDFIYNLPQLVWWIQENINKPIKKLNNDECEIISGIMGNLNYDEMFEYLNLKSVKNYTDIDNIIKGLPEKFSVENITQVLFKIILLKPQIYRQITKEAVINSIKSINELNI